MIYDLTLPQGCPKTHVGEFEGIAYRVVKTDPPTIEDLKTYLELDLLPRADPCKRGSVSLYSTLEEARHRLDVSPHLGTFVASVSLTKAHGKVSEPTEKGHIDWWPYKNMRRIEDLKVA